MWILYFNNMFAFCEKISEKVLANISSAPGYWSNLNFFLHVMHNANVIYKVQRTFHKHFLTFYLNIEKQATALEVIDLLVLNYW